MVRLAVVLAVLAVGFVLLRERSADVGAGAATVPQVNTATLPREFKGLLAARPDPAQVLRQRGALPGLGAIRRFTAKLGSHDETPAMRPFADVGSARELRKVRGDIRRDFTALNRLSNKGGASPLQVQATLTQVYSATVLASLGTDGRRDFAELYAGRTRVAQKIKVLDFEGVFVSGRRALAQIVYQLSTRAPSGRFVARAPQTWTVTLAREGGRWRFVQGIES
jgi:hypothetical protein